MVRVAKFCALVLVVVGALACVCQGQEVQSDSGRREGEGLTPDLASWLSEGENPTQINTKISQDTFQGMGKGFRANQNIEANETLMEVPAKVFLSLKTAAESRLGPIVVDLFQRNGSANSILALHLLCERHLGDASNFSSYLNTLPSTFDLPLLWTNEELGQLNGTQLLAKVLQQRSEIQEEFDNLVNPVLQSPQHAELLRDLSLETVGDSFFKEYLWAHCCVLSRAFLLHTSDPNANPLPVLIPGVDVFNTGQHVDTQLEIDQVNEVVKVVTRQAFAQGDQVFLNTGREPNLGYMLTQGFALANNPADYVELFVSFDPRDPFSETKKKILEYLGVLPDRPFLLQRRGKIPQDLINTLRVHTMKPSEFDDFKELERNNPLSLQNELAVSREILVVCQKSLQAFPTSVKEDDELLLQSQGALSPRLAHAIMYRRSEKLVYIEAMTAISDNWNNILFAGGDSF